MPWMLSRHHGLKATFNITPPLIEQLLLYQERPQEHDRFLELWLDEPQNLHEDDRNWMIKLCKSAPLETMVAPLPYYRALYEQEHYRDADLLDLQVWFMLAWCGVYLRQNNPVVQELMKRSGGFCSADKAALLESLSAFVKEIFPFYAKLQKEGTISLSTTPLNHPILPLLLDMQNAERAHSGTPLPHNAMSLEADARLQISEAQKLFRETFGLDAVGFWPAEGAVDTKSVALYKEAGLKWIATDEAILFKSLGSEDRKALYKMYDFEGVKIGFRDHGLSDLIGFTYRFWEPHSAAEHFVSALHKIEEAHDNADVFVILDGENAWEFYENNAFDFFDALYSELSKTTWCQSKGMDDLVDQASQTLETLAPGSWIHGAFNTWVGHPEKSRAWELIFMTRRDYEHHKSSVDAEVDAKIIKHFLAAECSDWFWWYGDDHMTAFSSEFDTLFRGHLITIYELLGITAPADLFVPVLQHRSGENFLLAPQFMISPTINGRHDSFFEWVGCGVVDETKVFGTMDRVRGPVERIYFGRDEHHLYCAFEGDMVKLRSCERLVIFIEPLSERFEIDMAQFCKEEVSPFEEGSLKMQVACHTYLELSIAIMACDCPQLQLRFELEKEGRVIQTLPGFGELTFELEDSYIRNWFV